MASKLADIQDIVDKTFDYVVVGGGTAGCVVASRLAEDPDVTVAVLEAGPPQFGDSIIEDPAAFMKLMLDPKYDHMYTTTPQLRAGDQPVLWSRFFPPPKNELSEFETFHDSESVGYDGPVPLIFSRDSSGAEALWQKSLAKYGVEVNTANLDGNATGTFKTVSNINPETRQRAHSATTYLIPALTGQTSQSDGDVAASGVEFEHGGRVYTVFVKEVVLSAGAIKSPHILELSGIGDRKILEPLGIEVKIDLPGVGANVQDHVSMGFNRWKLKEDQNIVTSGMLQDPAQAEKLRIAL
ncbi:uncharacterized protein PHACADRAFT_214131 [Phanerochaete carnosa HHB-10118-sp]|uniref:Glucose-methanol-choline oxidoreductase N-terminal domain-containing protein n=1 Tax=Phanerochaete carnosa (strain HHB-10118-sp) TaxID=650164 RepID=K5VS17_PHACS|nr:uncharacterized protein PHACADRAFT_214131 [Phanerochaete carnosa HHB-10118-sp]EKM49570.1 hypothetical protein PHACADRAFT_214131 [Phanerochaete carnosa HHB-10118-sp]